VIRDFNLKGVNTDVYFPSLRPIKEIEVQDGPDTETIPKGSQNDTGQLRLGMEYILIGKKVIIPLRAGCFVDTQYFPDSSDDAITFFGITAGFGIKTGGLSIDCAIVYESGKYLDGVMDYSATGFSDLRLYTSAIYSF
ncbi:MAG: hypothetical protein GY757_26650, partial [bacterium]|nr:hypothetical protein [bacterium]